MPAFLLFVQNDLEEGDTLDYVVGFVVELDILLDLYEFQDGDSSEDDM